ncbi:hypothetical protein [Candidatus Bealeia paramacronuclearis]|uniref:hypothetical protein n=1 Tax=Candidatus Bealeia paramacronuclearis TaxID=1921001 RepID=UPI0030D0C10A
MVGRTNFEEEPSSKLIQEKISNLENQWDTKISEFSLTPVPQKDWVLATYQQFRR